MDRLDFTLPDFTRFSWVSDVAREAWEPKFSRITKAWLDIEWLAVESGVRRCCITMASPEDFVARAGDWARHGLSALPLEVSGIQKYYSSAVMKAKLEKPFAFRFVLGTPKNVAVFKSAFDTGNDEAMANMLGYPRCCYSFFRRVWVEQGQVDTTWAMATTGASQNGNTTIDVGGPPEANILVRWMGIRAVPHLPCRTDCRESVAFGKKLVEIGRKAGYGTEMDWLLEVLSWPVEWSALHGIAEIKTPVLKVSTCTDATPKKYVVRRHGSAYPLEGAPGLAFPFRTPLKPLLTSSRGFERGLENPITPQNGHPVRYQAENEFSSNIAMAIDHEPIVKLAVSAFLEKGGNVLDLGCGNGILLREIHQANSGIVPFGIDMDPSRVEHAQLANPDFARNFTVGDMFESDQVWPKGRRYGLAVVMPGRFLEAGAEQAARLRGRLMEHCDQILVYASGEWLTRYQNLEGLASRAGFSLLGSSLEATASLASAAVQSIAQ